jgi:hypothetical protein
MRARARKRKAELPDTRSGAELMADPVWRRRNGFIPDPDWHKHLRRDLCKAMGDPVPPEYCDEPKTWEVYQEECHIAWQKRQDTLKAWQAEERAERLRLRKERWQARVNWLKRLVAELRAMFSWPRRKTGND